MKQIRNLILLLSCCVILISCSSRKESRPHFEEYLNAEQRIKSLIDAYTAVNTYSVCWHDMPDFSYSEMLTEIIQQAAEPIDAYAYCLLLEELTAVTGDAHNHFGYNPAMMESFGYLTYKLEYIDHQYIVTGVSAASQVPIGSELIQIQDQEPGDYLEENIAPLVASKSFRFKQNKMLERFTFNRQKEKIRLTWKTPDGEVKTTEEVYEKNVRRLIETYPKPPLSDSISDIFFQSSTYDVYLLEEDIVYIHLKVMSDIEGSFYPTVLPQLADYHNFIIDIRDNSGGSDIAAFQLLSAFFDQVENFQSYELASDIEWMGSHLGSHPERKFEVTNSRTVNLKKGWDYDIAPAIQADQLILLINENTMSAAESLALLASGLDRFTLMGTPTAGSCGLRYAVTLEDLGFSFAFTSKGTLDYDGQSLYGIGIEPDLLIEQKVEDLKQGIDTVLEAAMHQIQQYRVEKRS